MPQTPNINYFTGNPAVSRSYSVEFDDAIADTRFWKARSEGTQLRGQAVNTFNEGDITYGKTPVVENKIAALYIGTTIIGADEDPSRVSINGHSFITIDRILLIDIETDEVQIINRQSIVDINSNTIGVEKAFKRFISRDFFEGSEINIRLIDKTVQNSLKPAHRVKFNRGSLMKIYEYTPNDEGHEDGVFGGHSIRNNFGNNSHRGSLMGPGLFGFGMTAAVSRSLFNENSIEFVSSLPTELNNYSGDINLGAIDELCPITASVGGGFSPVNIPATVNNILLNPALNISVGVAPTKN